MKSGTATSAQKGKYRLVRVGTNSFLPSDTDDGWQELGNTITLKFQDDGLHVDVKTCFWQFFY